MKTFIAVLAAGLLLSGCFETEERELTDEEMQARSASAARLFEEEAPAAPAERQWTPEEILAARVQETAAGYIQHCSQYRSISDRETCFIQASTQEFVVFHRDHRFFTENRKQYPKAWIQEIEDVVKKGGPYNKCIDARGQARMQCATELAQWLGWHHEMLETGNWQARQNLKESGAALAAIEESNSEEFEGD